MREFHLQGDNGLNHTIVNGNQISIVGSNGIVTTGEETNQITISLSQEEDLTTNNLISETGVFDTVTTKKEFRILDDDNSNFIGFKAPNEINNNIIWTLPPIDGIEGSVIQTDGVGNLTFVEQTGIDYTVPVSYTHLTLPTKA